jgi:predicted unusual protein kinase regulating ubiquinone biosynthesis (AarF/ABC1/UbiB family)
MADSNVPTSRLGRLARLAALGARTGAGMLLKREGDAGGAAQAAAVLGQLRGLAAKVGQMASYVDGVVPEAQREVYETALKALRSQAPRSTPAQIHALMQNELPAEARALIANFEDTPIASASIGQVHRATLHDGRVVAIKVQHTGIRQAVESDLQNAGLLGNFAGFAAGKRIDAKRFLEVVKARFREELDYQLEARNILEFQGFHRGDATIVIPNLVPELCAPSVLTTEFHSGLSLEEAALCSEPERRAWAETMWRYVFKGNLVGRKFNADPHPGNYFFKPDGVVVFLDYGCVQAIGSEFHANALRMHRSAIARSESDFAQCVRVLLDTRPGALEDEAVAFSRQCFEPIFGAPYRITRPWAGSLVKGMTALGDLVKRVPDSEFFNMPADMLFLNRLQFGFYSVLARLDVAVDYAAVETAFLDAAGL